MPTSSLWLVPPRSNHPCNESLKNLIDNTIPSNYPSVKPPSFLPHVTVVQDVHPLPEDPQQWIENLSLPPMDVRNEATIEFDAIEAGDDYFRKLTLRARKDELLLKLAATLRSQALSPDDDKAGDDQYSPHLSLMYADLSTEDVEKAMSKIELQIGFEFGSLFDCCGGMLCQGAKLVLVDTSGKVEDWKVIAERHLERVVWRAGREIA